MSKDKISDYSATANSNTDIAGINIDEGCAPSGINNAIRTLMKQLKDFQQGTNSDSFNGPTNGAHNGTVGATTPAAGTFTTLSASGVTTLSAGSASAPALTTSGDTNTGVLFPAADTVAIATGGTERARVDSSGNLGLGVTPSAWSATYKALQVGGSVGLWGGASSELAIISSNAYLGGSGYARIIAGYATRYTQNVGTHSWSTAATSTSGSAITWTDAMTLDASGNLGVGTTSPLSVAGKTFEVTGTSYAFSFVSDSTGTVRGQMYADHANDVVAVGSRSNHPLLFTINNTEKARIDSSGNFTIGGQSATRLEVNLTENDKVELNAVDSTNTARNLVFSTGDTERARIDSSGNLLVGKTALSGTTVGFQFKSTGELNSGMAASTNSDSTLSVYSTGAGAYRFYVGLAGTVYATSTTISAISDIRFKENVRDLNAGLAEVMALKPRLYDWKEGKGANIKNARGFIAQEFEEVFPDLIDEWKDPAPEGEEPYKSVRQDLIPVLVKAIQEQQAIIESLKARLDAANL